MLFTAPKAVILDLYDNGDEWVCIKAHKLGLTACSSRKSFNIRCFEIASEAQMSRPKSGIFTPVLPLVAATSKATWSQAGCVSEMISQKHCFQTFDAEMWFVTWRFKLATFFFCHHCTLQHWILCMLAPPSFCVLVSCGKSYGKSKLLSSH